MSKYTDKELVLLSKKVVSADWMGVSLKCQYGLMLKVMMNLPSETKPLATDELADLELSPVAYLLKYPDLTVLENYEMMARAIHYYGSDIDDE